MTISDIEPRTHVGRWRVRSPVAAVIDRMMAVVGFAMIMVAATNSLVSWRSNTILLMPGQVERVMGIVPFRP
jgi:hypothetical protein